MNLNTRFSGFISLGKKRHNSHPFSRAGLVKLSLCTKTLSVKPAPTDRLPQLPSHPWKLRPESDHNPPDEMDDSVGCAAVLGNFHAPIQSVQWLVGHRLNRLDEIDRLAER